MVKLVTASFSIRGDTLSPVAVEHATSLAFLGRDKREPGEIASRGRYKGQPSPYGSAILFAPDEAEDEDKLVWLLDAFQPHADTIRKLGATDGSLYLSYAYESQCNLAFDPALLARIVALGFDFWITCYDDPDEFSDHSAMNEPGGSFTN